MEKAVLEFIQQHEAKATAEVALLLSKQVELPKEFILNQINGRQKAKQKFSFLNQVKGFHYPSARAVAQSSSDKTAEYKASIISAQHVADLSGGMGIDAYFFSKYAQRVVYIEQNQELADLSKRNFTTLTASNITTHSTHAISFLEDSKDQFDLIYIDPDRRTEHKRVFRINECEPNVAELLPLIWEKSPTCLVKLSPMLDISQALEELPHCAEVHVVSVNNECKELLFLLKRNFVEAPSIHCVNLKKEGTSQYSFFQEEESYAAIDYGRPTNFLYEPNASILKAGAFKKIAQDFRLKKLASNSHLYTSDLSVENFPGRKVKIVKSEKPQKGFIEKANIVCRNFPLKPREVKKKYKIKEGGDLFLYATTVGNKETQFILGKLV